MIELILSIGESYEADIGGIGACKLVYLGVNARYKRHNHIIALRENGKVNCYRFGNFFKLDGRIKITSWTDVKLSALEEKFLDSILKGKEI